MTSLFLFKKSLATSTGKKQEKFLNIMKYWTKSSIEDALLILKKQSLELEKILSYLAKKLFHLLF